MTLNVHEEQCLRGVVPVRSLPDNWAHILQHNLYSGTSCCHGDDLDLVRLLTTGNIDGNQKEKMNSQTFMTFPGLKNVDIILTVACKECVHCFESLILNLRYVVATFGLHFVIVKCIT